MYGWFNGKFMNYQQQKQNSFFFLERRLYFFHCLALDNILFHLIIIHVDIDICGKKWLKTLHFQKFLGKYNQKTTKRKKKIQKIEINRMFLACVPCVWCLLYKTPISKDIYSTHPFISTFIHLD